MADSKTQLEYRKAFQKAYYNKIIPTVKKFDEERKRKRTLAIGLTILCFVLSALFFFIFPNFEKDSFGADFFGFLWFVSLVLGFSVYGLIKKDFENKIKARIMPFVCSCFGNLKWEEKYCDVDFEEFTKKTGIVGSFNRSYYDDTFKGSFEGVKLQIIEVEYTMVTGSGKNRSESAVFKGVFVKLDMNKNFSGRTVIRPDSLLHFSPQGLRRTEFEDVLFEKKFDVFTDDEVEARYLITPTFMERLENLKMAFKADKISCAFFDKTLLVALHTRKDLFNLCKLNVPLTDREAYFTMFNEMISIMQIIKHFKLNQRIGL